MGICGAATSWSAGDLVTAAVIDPACFYGHAEIDLAMLGLFDRPGAGILTRRMVKLAAGYTERLPIYRLWPALVHLRLFGEGYSGLVEGPASSSWRVARDTLPARGTASIPARSVSRAGLEHMADSTMAAQMSAKGGFIAALDQSGGSTPGALKAYGIPGERL